MLDRLPADVRACRLVSRRLADADCVWAVLCDAVFGHRTRVASTRTHRASYAALEAAHGDPAAADGVRQLRHAGGSSAKQARSLTAFGDVYRALDVVWARAGVAAAVGVRVPLDDVQLALGESEKPRAMRVFELMWMAIHEAERASGCDFPGFGTVHVYDMNVDLRLVREKSALTIDDNVLVAFAFCEDSFVTHCIDVGDETVYRHANGQLVALADSLHEYLLEMALGITVGQYAWREADGDAPQCFSRFQALYGSGRAAVTGDISISVATLPIVEARMLAYELSIDMSPDAPESASCVLETRDWVMWSSGQQVDDVHGPGVVGLYPELHPGTHFHYASLSQLSVDTRPIGDACSVDAMRASAAMDGFLTFRMLNSGALIDVAVPTFRTSAHPYAMPYCFVRLARRVIGDAARFRAHLPSWLWSRAEAAIEASELIENDLFDAPVDGGEDEDGGEEEE